MKYTPKFFYDNLPAWKRKKDPVLSRIIYRPLSFVTASLFSNAGIGANAVSYASAVLAIAACALFLPSSLTLNIIGAVLINIWLLLDCTDGNMARSVRKQLFGEFADGISSYILVALMCTCMGVSVYHQGGVLVPAGSVWIVVIGALASSADTLMRLIYQKYNAEYNKHVKQGILPELEDKRTDHSQVGSLRVRIESELGIGGILPVAILLGTIFHFLDVIVIYCLLYYGGSCLVASLMYIRKAIKISKSYDEEHANEQ